MEIVTKVMYHIPLKNPFDIIRYKIEGGVVKTEPAIQLLPATTNEFGIVVDAIPKEDKYQIFFFNTEEIIPYNSDYICTQPVFHIPINDISDIRRCYINGDKVESVPLTANGSDE